MNHRRLSPTLIILLVAAALAQAPVIGIIDFYGLQRVSPERIRKTLGFKEGDPLPPSKADVEERLDEIPGVVASHLEAVCCDSGKAILYVGLQERGTAVFDVREPPQGELSLPEEISAEYGRFREAVADAVRRGETGEDLTRGYSLSADPVAREIELKFPDLVKEHWSELRDVLRTAGDEDQRAIAADMIGYAPVKRDALDELQYALRDADPGVRANATHGLTALAVYAKLNPDAGIKVEPTWFIEMLNSLSWSDRQHALKVLQILTDSRDPAVLGQLRERALPALVEMSRWRTLDHALPAFVLIGRIAGWSEARIEDAWTRGDRESVIAAASGKKQGR
jgi:hypothetical protein